MNTEFTESDASQPPSLDVIEVALGIVVRGIPNESRNHAQIITRTNCDQTSEYEILITRRPEHTVYGGYWELPGGKCEDGEDMDDCARRELREEVGIEIEILTPLNERVHAYDHATVRLHPRVCRLAPGSPQPRALHVADVRWERLDRIVHDQFPEANQAVIAELIGLVRSGGLGRELGMGLGSGAGPVGGADV